MPGHLRCPLGLLGCARNLPSRLMPPLNHPTGAEPTVVEKRRGLLLCLISVRGELRAQQFQAHPQGEYAVQTVSRLTGCEE